MSVDVGYTSIGPDGLDNPSNNAVWCKVAGTPASNGTLDSISVHCAIKLSPGKFYAALYADSGGSGPTGSALASNLTGVNAGASFGWVTITIGGSYAIVSGMQYWICIVVDYPGGSDIDVKFLDQGATNELYYKTHGLASFPTASGLSAQPDERWSTYFTYTASGGGGGVVGSPIHYYRRRWLN